MKVELKTTPGLAPYYTVLVEKDELDIGGGKKLPFSTWLGTISPSGNINLWTPAGYCPRGYKKAALAVLESVAQKIKDGTWDGSDQITSSCTLYAPSE
jgi:hypothetical protein